jgi:phosphatidylserine synthase
MSPSMRSQILRYLPSGGCVAIAVYWLVHTLPWDRNPEAAGAGFPVTNAAVFAALAAALVMRIPGARVATYTATLLLLAFFVVGLPLLSDRPYPSALVKVVLVPDALVAILLALVVLTVLPLSNATSKP